MAIASKRLLLNQSHLTSLAVGNFKSIGPELTIDIKPLTLIAGVNSSGKTSILQPLLLLKQTLECSYDPGALLLDGPNARFTRADQMVHIDQGRRKTKEFSVALGIGPANPVLTRFRFSLADNSGVDLKRIELVRDRHVLVLEEGKTYRLEEVIDSRSDGSSTVLAFQHETRSIPDRVQLNRDRFMLEATVDVSAALFRIPNEELYGALERVISGLIHLPGHRGNPSRTYARTAPSGPYQGTFEYYVASVIDELKRTGEKETLGALRDDLRVLGLTWDITSVAIDDTQVELRVGRTPKAPRKPKESDFVSIADVGFGVSQTLPVVVALRVARPNRTVYIEQPETHLHPRAQHAMANLLVDAANRGVRVICETHSSILLLGIQSLVAEGKLDPDKVKLHWFERGESDGVTRVTSSDIDEAGRFGDWPVDFDDVSLKAQMDYLNFSRARQAGNGKSTNGKRKAGH